MIQAVFSASEKNPSFTIVSFTSCERDSDIIFLCKFAQLRGYTVERNWSFSVKFIDDFNAGMILETTDYLLISSAATPSRLYEVLHQHAFLAQLHSSLLRVWKYIMVRSIRRWWRTKSWPWTKGQGLCTEKQVLAAAGRMLIFIQDWFERLSFNFLVLSFWMQTLAWQICYSYSQLCKICLNVQLSGHAQKH